jgi:hypothetical protein
MQTQPLIKNPKNSILETPFILHINWVLSDAGQVSDRWLTGLKDGVPRSFRRTMIVEGLSFRVPDRLERRQSSMAGA